MRRTWSLVASSESCSEARAAGAEAICSVPVTVFVWSAPVSTMPPITPAATSGLAAIAAGGGLRERARQRPQGGRPAPPAPRRRLARRAGALVGTRPGGGEQLCLRAHDAHDAV